MRQSVSEVKWAGIKSGEPSKNNESGGAAMTEAMRQLRTATSSLLLLVDAFHFLALFAIGATTVWSAAAAFFAMAAQGCATLGDILLLFIYLEIGAMIGIYFKTTRLPVRYLI
jgi:protein PsiE